MGNRRVLSIALIIFAIDQLSKTYVVHYLNLREKISIDVISPILNFRMAWNRGINFGLFDSGGSVSRWGLIVLSVAISVMLLFWVRKSENFARQIGVAMIIGGALGNAMDRIVFGAVADFLNMSCCGIQNPFSFNLADMAIFIGAFSLILWDKSENEVG